MPLKIESGDILTLKKPHACGTNAWQVYRVGADFGLRCSGCDRRVLLPRSKVEPRIKLIERAGQLLKPADIKD